MIKGTTSLGFNFKIEDNVMDDWTLVEAMSQIEVNPLKAVEVLQKMLGLKQYEQLKRFVKNKTGQLKSTDMITQLNDIMSTNEETKK